MLSAKAVKTDTSSLAILETQIDVLSSILKRSFGSHGSSILFDRNGSVYTTKDATEILSLLSFEDPFIKLFISSLLKSSKVKGGGTKLTLFLVQELLHSLTRNIQCSSECLKRTQMIECLHRIKRELIPHIQTQTINELQSIVLKSKHDSVLIFRSILVTKFHTNVRNILADLLASYFLELENDGLFNSLRSISEDPSLWILQVPELPTGTSTVLDCFVITRPFRPRSSASRETLEKCCFVLWSVDLSEDPDHRVLVSTPEQLASSYCYRSFTLNAALKRLQNDYRINVILASVHVPEWAEGIFLQNKIVFVDMIDLREFEFVKMQFRVTEITSLSEMARNKVLSCATASFEPFIIGRKRYTKLHCDCRQILICGPSLSHTSQYAKGCHQACVYLRNWISSTRNINQQNQNSLIVSNSYAVFVKVHRLLNQFPPSQKVPGSPVKVLLETVKAILKLFYDTQSRVSDGKFVQYLNNENNWDKFSPEDPFAMFDLVRVAIDELISLLRIERIMFTNNRLKNDLEQAHT